MLVFKLLKIIRIVASAALRVQYGSTWAVLCMVDLYLSSVCPVSPAGHRLLHLLYLLWLQIQLLVEREEEKVHTLNLRR